MTRLQCADSFPEFCRIFIELRGPAVFRFLRSQVAFTRLGKKSVALDSVLRFERLEEDYKRLRERLDMPSSPLPQLNVGKTIPPLTRAHRNLVERLLPNEFEVFGY